MLVSLVTECHCMPVSLDTELAVPKHLPVAGRQFVREEEVWEDSRTDVTRSS